MDCWSRSPCLLLLLLLLVSAAIVHVETATCTNDDPCVADCAGCTQYDKVADPTNCRGYYLCDNAETPYSTPFVCNDGEVYDAEIHECVAGDTCNPCVGECNYECSETLTAVAFPLACELYTDCSSGAIQQCQSESPFFDGSSCQTDVTRCCHCRPYCYTADLGTLIADPQDCRKYYGCTAVGFTDIKGECPDGQYFDLASQGCSAMASCSTVDACRNVVGEDGCIDPFTCLATGSFAKCPSLCSPQYYSCEADDREFTDAISCSGDYVFDPDSKTCVSPSQCPY